MTRFDVSHEEVLLIWSIAHRAVRLFPKWKPIDIQRDVIATHTKGEPLRLQDLLDADDVDFAHDIAGIHRHLDRSTGKLKDCFVPRFAEL